MASLNFPRLLGPAALAVALMMLGLVLTPVRLWHHPVNDAVFQGFDPSLAYLDSQGDGSTHGIIDVSSASVRLTALPGSEPTIDLVTSPLSFTAAMDIRVLEPVAAGDALNVGIWSPSAGAGYYLNFGSEPTDLLSTQAITGGLGSKTLVGGRVVQEVPIGTYSINRVYHVTIALDKNAGTITTIVREAPPTSNAVNERPLIGQTVVVSATQFPDVFTAFRPTLSVTLTSITVPSSAAVANYSLTLPSQPKSAAELVEKIDDSRARLITILLSLAGGILCVIALIRWFRPKLRSIGNAKPFWARKTALSARALGLFSIGVGAYVLLNSYLFHFGTPHFDIFTPKVWSYIATQYSFLDLYHRPFVTPAAAVQGGIPTHEAVFPYGPTKTYYYLFVGWVYRLVLSPSGNLLGDTFKLEFLLKLMNVFFALATSLLMYRILIECGVKPSRVRLAVALFVLNPALLFVMSIWGSTETVSLFFMLLSFWLAQKDRPALAWIALALGAFTRPQMLVLAFLLGCTYLRRFDLKDNLRAMSWSVIVFFLVLTPLSLAISPSLPIDYVSHVLGFQVGTGQADPNFSAISPGYYSIWTLPLMYVNGQHGIDRMWYPRTTNLFGSINYAQASAILVVAFLLSAGLLLLRRRPHKSMRDHIPLIAFGVLGWLVLSDSLISRYFLYGLALVILCRYSFRSDLYYASIAWLSFIILITAWSHFGLDVLGYQALQNPLNPVNSPITRAIQQLFFNDRFITIGTVLNFLLLVVVGVLAIKGPASPIEPGIKPASTPTRIGAVGGTSSA